MGKMLRKLYTSEAKEVQGEERTLVVKISTATPDRSNDVVIPSGVVLDNYLKNPVVAAFHNYSKPPIGKATEIAHTADGVVAKVQFTPQGVNPEADMIYELNKGGFMNAWSIGFIPKKWIDMQDGGRQFDEIELLEFSAVLVPDNPEALTLLRSKGFNPEELEVEAKSFDIDAEVDIEEKEEEEVETKEVDPETKEIEDVEEKDVAEVTSLSYVISELNWLIKAFENNGVYAESTEKMKVALASLLEVVKDQAEIGKKSFVMKEGRVLSEKNLKTVSSAKEKMLEAVKAIDDLLELSEKAPSESVEEEKTIVEPEIKEVDSNAVDFLKGIQAELRKNDKGVGLLLRSINDYLKNSKSIEEEVK